MIQIFQAMIVRPERIDFVEKPEDSVGVSFREAKVFLLKLEVIEIAANSMRP